MEKAKAVIDRILDAMTDETALRELLSRHVNRKCVFLVLHRSSLWLTAVIIHYRFDPDGQSFLSTMETLRQANLPHLAAVATPKRSANRNSMQGITISSSNIADLGSNPMSVHTAVSGGSCMTLAESSPLTCVFALQNGHGQAGQQSSTVSVNVPHHRVMI
jgi:hypothetical protein